MSTPQSTKPPAVVPHTQLPLDPLTPVPQRAWPITSLVTWGLCALLLGPFLLYPVARVMLGALLEKSLHNGVEITQFNPSLLLLPWQNPLVRQTVLNSFLIGVGATRWLRCSRCRWLTSRRGCAFPAKAG
jgi:hypothetical protein